MGRIPMSSPRGAAARAAVVVLAAGVAAGCSSDATRLTDGPLFAGSTSNQQQILGGNPAATAPVTSVASQGFVAPTETAANPAGIARGGWTTVNAPMVTVGAGESLALLSQRHGVPADVIMKANGLTNPAQVAPGRQLVMPTYVYRDSEAMLARTADTTQAVATGAPQQLGQLSIPANEAARTPDAVAVGGAGGTYVVQPGETLWAVARKHGVSAQDLMAANGVSADYRVRAGEQLQIPASGAATASTAVAAATPAAGVANSADGIARDATNNQPESQPREVEVASLGSEVTRSGPVMSDAVAANPEPRADEGSVAGFRWPARGRIVAGFGKQPNGDRNDGINLALPAGTPIKAAQSGKVIYAGNELQGYGNLVLVQHDGGWVTAYAHNDELLVQRGDAVRRGQVISTAGSSGSVNQPQLHFELRQGSKPVDPLPHLTGA